MPLPEVHDPDEDHRRRVEANIQRMRSWLTEETLAKLAVLLRPDRQP